MRHRKKIFKNSKTSSHTRCMMANMLKSLIENEKIETTLVKAKELKRRIDKIITLAKKDTLESKRMIKAKLMLNFNYLTNKQKKTKDKTCYNTDRKVFDKLKEYVIRYKDRKGGYTRTIKAGFRRGDAAPKCFIKFLK